MNWAKELGIDLEQLAEERPLHPRQAFEKRKHEERARKFWDAQGGRERRLGEAEDLDRLSELQMARFLKTRG